MENKIKNLPAKAQLQRHAIRLVLTCAVVLIINNRLTPELNWGWWVTAGLCGAFLFDLIDYLFIKHNTKNEE